MEYKGSIFFCDRGGIVINRSFGFCGFIFAMGNPFDINPVGDKYRDGSKQYVEFERRKIGGLHSTHIIANQVAGTKYEIEHGAEHTPIAKSNCIKKVYHSHLEGIASKFFRLSAAGTVVALIMIMTVGALMFLAGHWLRLIWPLLPLPELLEFLFEVETALAVGFLLAE